MVISGVKRKFPVVFVLTAAALVTALMSWAKLFPASWVEIVYSRRMFPTISHIGGWIADSLPFGWIDVWLVVVGGVVVFSLLRRNWRVPLGLASAVYILFFWGWGLNYHRTPIESRIGLKELPKPSAEEFHEFSNTATTGVNRLWRVVAEQGTGRQDSADIEREATLRVQQVISDIDGTRWRAAARIKHSYLADIWFHAAGIDGVFNPLPHEPILVGGIAEFQLPFLSAHELAHVYGIADEGDANFVAFLATMGSPDPLFQYSGAFELWLRLGSPTSVLDPGPRRDLQMLWDRIRRQEIPQIRNFQAILLDSHLKANGVQDGVKSYSKFVVLAIATRDRWGDFK